MARPIEFDPSVARERAMMLFWRKGYQAASLADLLAAMGIARGSLYAVFGDKRRLFVECLDLFAARTGEVLARARSKHPPLAALRQFFERSFITGDSSRSGMGCMLVNTVIELSGVDDDLSARAGAHLADIEAAFRTCLQEAGYGRARCAELAAFLMTFNEGLRVASRRNLPRREQVDRIDTAFGMLKDASS